MKRQKGERANNSSNCLTNKRRDLLKLKSLKIKRKKERKR
jgi:hypothetical protein